MKRNDSLLMKACVPTTVLRELRGRAKLARSPAARVTTIWPSRVSLLLRRSSDGSLQPTWGTPSKRSEAAVPFCVLLCML